ncbi:MAG: glycosyl hydrolase [Verrucomicrobiota bacterium]
MSNPATEGKYNDRGDRKTVQHILEGNIVNGIDARANFYRYLDDAADFFNAMKDDKGKLIPIFFRPLYEQYHNTFWWSGNAASAEQYNQLWYEMVSYLLDTKGVRNLIYIISPNKADTMVEYMEQFPGHDWVDGYGIDWYNSTDFSKSIEPASELIVGMAREHNKIAVLSEIGVKDGMASGTQANWYCSHALRLEANPVASEVAWFLQWSSKLGNKKSWTPVREKYRPDIAHVLPDFEKFYNNGWTMFENEIAPLRIYDFKSKSPVPIITTTELRGVSSQASYLQSIAVTGGDGPLTWSLEAGELPAGLALNQNTGQISGRVTGGEGEYGIAIRVSDADGDSDVRIFAIDVVPSDDLEGGLIIHLDATIQGSIVGNPVTRWKDQSRNKKHANVYHNSITYPSADLFASGSSSLDFGVEASALELFGATDSDAWLDQSVPKAQGFAVLLAYKRVEDTGKTREDLLGNNSKTGSGFLMRMFNGTLQSSLNGKTLSQGGSVAVGDSIVIGVNYDQDSGLFELWDSLSGSTSSTMVGAKDFSENAPVLLGMSTNNTRYLNGLVGEVKIFSRKLNALEFELEQDQFVSKWIANAGGGSISPVLLLHLDATKALNVEGSPVNRWLDTSGLNNHAVPYAGSVVYPSAQSFPSGLKGLDFGDEQNAFDLFANGGDSWLDQSAGATGFALFIAYKRTGNTSPQDLVGNSSVSGGFCIKLSSNGTPKVILGSQELTQLKSLTVGDSAIIAVNYNAGSGRLELWDSLSNSTVEGLVAAADFTVNRAVRLGTTSKSGRHAHGIIGEVKLFEGAMNAVEFAAEQKVMASKWLWDEMDYWASGLGVDIGDKNGDFDGDGLSNLVEYALGGAPMDRSVKAVPVGVEISEDYILFSHRKLIDDAGFIYQIQTSPNLEPGSWTDINPSIGNVKVVDGVYENVENLIENGPGSLFIRTKIMD